MSPVLRDPSMGLCQKPSKLAMPICENRKIPKEIKILKANEQAP
jgi:hypothetical protein